MNESKVKIGFSYEDEFGNTYEASSEVGIHESLGETELSVIGKRFNIFLKQIGFIRPNDNILMEDLTDKEFERLSDYLEQIRYKSMGVNNE